VRYRMMGGRKCSVLCLGTMFFGSVVDEERSFALLDRFMERGGNFIDTANCYCFWRGNGDGGSSERLLGRWMNARRNRNDVVVATKLGALPAGPDEWPGNREGLSLPVIREGIQHSLKRLETERIDLVYGHIDDPTTALEETVAAFAGLVKDGIADQIGMSNQGIERFVRSREIAQQASLVPFTAFQQRHTYLRSAAEADFSYQVPLDDAPLAYARTQPDMTVLAFSVLLQGAYTDPARPLPEQYKQHGTDHSLSVLRDVAAEASATPNQVIYAWLIGGSPAIVPVIGVSDIRQLDEALEAVQLELSSDQRERLDRARAGDS
jgi:aryl-alcohol dehydrogenase-like predicted oxidoreductase